MVTKTDSSLIVHDGGTVKDVLDAVTGSNGAASVGYQPAGTGAVATYVQEALRRSVSVFDFMTATQIADVMSGAASLDVTAAIQAALNSAVTASAPFGIQEKFRGVSVYCPRGRYRMTGGVTGKAGTSIIGDGYESTVFIHEGTSGDVFSFNGVDSGSVDFINLEGFAVAQKSGTMHTSGYAIKIDGNSFGTTPRIRDVYTYGTHDGLYLDWCYPGTIEGVHCFSHAGNGFTSRFNCTSTTFQNCYAGANGGSGFKIAGSYMSFVNCASDSNGSAGYEIWFDNGASSRGISFLGSGTENCDTGIIIDRALACVLLSPTLYIKSGGSSAIKLLGAQFTTIISPNYASFAANANPVIYTATTVGSSVQGTVVSGLSTNLFKFASHCNTPDLLFAVGSSNQVGMFEDKLRLGDRTYYAVDAQKLYIGGDFPTNASNIAYGQSNKLVANNAALSLAATWHSKPVVSANATRLIAGTYVDTPQINSGTVNRIEGIRVSDISGGTGNVNLALGNSVIPSGTDWSIYNVSTRQNLMGGPVVWGTSTGPQELFGTGSPEGVKTAPVGSTYRRADGGAGTSFYVKESGTGNTGWVAK